MVSYNAVSNIFPWILINDFGESQLKIASQETRDQRGITNIVKLLYIVTSNGVQTVHVQLILEYLTYVKKSMKNKPGLSINLFNMKTFSLDNSESFQSAAFLLREILKNLFSPKYASITHLLETSLVTKK